MENKKVLVDKGFLDELCGFLSGLYSFSGVPIYNHYIDKINKYIDSKEKIDKGDLRVYIDRIVHNIYDTYDGNEFEIYTLAYLNMCMNNIEDREGILTCFVNAIIDVTGKDFNSVYNKLIERIN